MRYINKLQESVKTKDEVIRETYSDLTDLLMYLQSSKFAEDNTVQIRTDIYPKLAEIRLRLVEENV